MSSLVLASTSKATDAGWLAAADIASVAGAVGVPYRLVGGLAVTLLVHVHGADELAPARETADADLGVPFDVCADDRLRQALLDVGYGQVQGNRFVRVDADGRELVVDVLTTSYTGRMESNQERGQLVVDAIPGLHTALREPATAVELTAVLTDRTELHTTLLLPDVAAALVLKAYAYRGRYAGSDAVDIHRLLEAANVAGRTAADWPGRTEGRDAAHVLHTSFGAVRRPNAALRGADARVRLLVQKIVATH
ncbi:hypothetical protein CTKZ_17020 [Cellulomonas algicola]|uniref:Nucleotidyltransferase AbiEii toxin of type IV toxin-antitoxin system n=1 Tax=Cellulomonas algicola TaxID=2071633 RepID=A0A401V006_9CELL|nr:hypothetical protein [Cellulomonas algicola]GCD20140.1 hypothetical protein CTKZ_17020 [Cellulomonas algicola]